MMRVPGIGLGPGHDGPSEIAPRPGSRARRVRGNADAGRPRERSIFFSGLISSELMRQSVDMPIGLARHKPAEGRPKWSGKLPGGHADSAIAIAQRPNWQVPARSGFRPKLFRLCRQAAVGVRRAMGVAWPAGNAGFRDSSGNAENA
jgi:hypothetical protein